MDDRSMPPLRLRPPRQGDERAVRAAQMELAADSFEFAFGLTANTGWSGHLAEYARQHRGIGLPPDRVPATYLLAAVADEIVGRTSIRHTLNDHLLAVGGHIGYGVRPAFRRRGFATEVLRQSLIVARALGVDAALLTCDDDNVGSAVVIERCGGVLDPDRPRTDGQRYWIA